MKTYILLGIIFFLSLLAASLIQANDFIKGVIAMPAPMALLAALLQIFRDQAAFEKQKYLDDRKRIFDIGATSHMANTAFDRHIAFCEEYIQEVNNTVVTLFREGPCEAALNHSNNAQALRRKYAIWLTDDIDIALEPFESTVRKIGADAGLVKATIHDPQAGEERQKAINEMYLKFKEVLGINDSIKEVQEEHAVEAVKRRIREILGVEELTEIRKYLVSEAIEALKKDS